MKEQSTSDLQAWQEKMTAMEKTLADLQKRDQVREKFLQERENYVNGLEKDLSIYKSQAEDLHTTYENGFSRLAQFDEERKQEVDRVTMASCQIGKDEGFKEGLTPGFIMGAHRCRSYVLMIPHGQTFLDTLVRGLLEAYLNSPDFWTRIDEPLLD